MTDREQDVIREPEPITPDNNFPKALFPSPTSNYVDPIHTYVRIYVSIFVHTILAISATGVRKFTTIAILLGY